MKTRSLIVVLLLLIPIGIVNVPNSEDAVVVDAIPTRAPNELTNNMDILCASEGSFIGEYNQVRSGTVVSMAGDVNGDGYDDILIGSPNNGEGGNNAGQTYLIFGNRTGWNYHMDLSQADASFIGEAVQDRSGSSLSGTGDVNGDGYDDFLIGSQYNKEGGNGAGQTYLILGKATGWKNDTNLVNASASFIGEANNDQSGHSVAGAGDVNNDGYDDILIGAWNNKEGSNNAGQTYLILGKATGWKNDTNLVNASASFIGEKAQDQSGNSVSGAGDVNGDGYDDFIIGAYCNDDGGNNAGKTYLILGKASGWKNDTKLVNASASFIGEFNTDQSGNFVSGAGDVNGDNYDDILIGARQNDEGGNDAGQTYLILGKASEWKNNTNLVSANASFIGENGWDYSGNCVSGAGDVNNDGFDDLLIGARGFNGGTNTGKTYLIHGKASGWKNDTNLVNSNASFNGEFNNDVSGNSVSGGGDINGDGYDDILVGSPQNKYGGNNAGQTYLITGNYNCFPTKIYNIEFFEDQNYTMKTTIADIGSNVYFEITGEDGNVTHRDFLLTTIDFPRGQDIRRFVMIETEIDSGTYRGDFVVPGNCNYFENISVIYEIDPSKYANISVDSPQRPLSVSRIDFYSDPELTIKRDKFYLNEIVYIKVTGVDSRPDTVSHAFINITSDKNESIDTFMIIDETGFNTGIYTCNVTVPQDSLIFENYTVLSFRNTEVNGTFMVHIPIEIRPYVQSFKATEDQEFRSLSFWNFGYESGNWSLSTPTPWIKWDGGTGEIYGTPDNRYVGKWDVQLSIANGKGQSDSMDIQITVKNVPPLVIGEDINEIVEGEYYYNDYDCTDDGYGNITWSLTTQSTWLTINPSTGELFGTPEFNDVGIHYLTVFAHDGNGGKGQSSFEILVTMINRPPEIITQDLTTGTQDERYFRDYEATDLNEDDTLEWFLETNASFLSIDKISGKLSGTPERDDVGSFFVNVTVKDQHGTFDSHEFILTITDINDAPEWTDLPIDAEVVHGSSYSSIARAMDYDIGSTLMYSIESVPQSDISIDPQSGEIEWTASISWFDKEPYKLQVSVRVTDGEMFKTHFFKITVLTSQPPTVSLINPEDGGRLSSSEGILEWEGEDPDGDELTYDIYIHDTQAFVEGGRKEALIISEYQGNHFSLTGFEQGKRFYWKVVPHDGCVYGECTGKVRSFTLNYPPGLTNVPNQEIPYGKEFKFRLSTSDEDDIDKNNLVHMLIDPPEGMTISEETGTIKWTPSSDQEGWHTIKVCVSDGIENTTKTFDIEVVKRTSEGAGSILIYVIVSAIVLLILGVVIFFFVETKAPPEKKKKDKMDPESREVIKAMEEHKKEIKWEHDHYHAFEGHTFEIPINGEQDPVKREEITEHILK